jgi:hypothetical protein
MESVVATDLLAMDLQVGVEVVIQLAVAGVVLFQGRALLARQVVVLLTQVKLAALEQQV